MADEPTDRGAAGVDRRSLIKRAAAAGAVAWTAPIIVDSLASPAAAATLATGCYSTQYTAANPCAVAAPGTPCATLSGYPAANAFPGGNIACTNSGGDITYSLAGSNCAFVRGNASHTQGGGSTCVTVGSGVSVLFDKPGGQNWNGNFHLVISCGNASC